MSDDSFAAHRGVDTSRWNLFGSVSRAMPVALIAACGPVLDLDGPGDSSGTDPTNPTDPSDPTEPTQTSVETTDPTGGECNDSSDCPYGYYCRDNFCEYECWCACGIAPPGELEVRCSPYYECYSDEECGPGAVCDYGFCQVDPECGSLPIPETNLEISFGGTPNPVAALLFAEASPADGAELIVARGAEVELVVDGAGTVVVQTDAAIVAMAAADLDADGIVDLVTATDTAAGAVQVWKGLGDGFAATGFAQPLVGATGLAIGDRQGDGVPDVYAHTGAGVVVFPGAPGAPLGLGEVAVTAEASAFAVFDVDGDGTSEVVYATGPELWLADVGAEPQSVAFVEATAIGSLLGADFSADGVFDLVAVGDAPSSMASIIGPVDVGSPYIAPLGLVPGAAQTGWIDEDGYVDLVVGFVDSTTILVRFGSPGAEVDVGPTEPFSCTAEYDLLLSATDLAVRNGLFGEVDVAATDGTAVRVLRLGS